MIQIGIMTSDPSYQEPIDPDYYAYQNAMYKQPSWVIILAVARAIRNYAAQYERTPDLATIMKSVLTIIPAYMRFSPTDIDYATNNIATTPSLKLEYSGSDWKFALIQTFGQRMSSPFPYDLVPPDWDINDPIGWYEKHIASIYNNPRWIIIKAIEKYFENYNGINLLTLPAFSESPSSTYYIEPTEWLARYSSMFPSPAEIMQNISIPDNIIFTEEDIDFITNYMASAYGYGVYLIHDAIVEYLTQRGQTTVKMYQPTNALTYEQWQKQIPIWQEQTQAQTKVPILVTEPDITEQLFYATPPAPPTDITPEQQKVIDQQIPPENIFSPAPEEKTGWNYWLIGGAAVAALYLWKKRKG